MNEMTMLEMHAGLMRDMAYDRDMMATELGRRSCSLRQQAQRLDAMDKREAAVELFRRAVAVFPEDDDSAAAAAACHDLANMLSDRRDGPSLVSAEALYRRALHSPARAQVPRRCAETENSLGLCLRRLAKLARGKERKRLIDETEKLYRGAIQRLEKIGPLGWETLANVHLNLGNLLGQDRKQMEPALREYASAARVARAVLEKVREASGEPRLSTRTSFNMAHLTSASMLRIRGGKQDLAKAEQHVNRVLEAKDPRFEPLGWLELAEITLAGNSPERHARARSLLERVRPEQIAEEFLLHLANALRCARAFEKALDVLRGCINLGIHHRAVKTIADFDADSASESFQQAAAMAARIQARDLHQPVASFLTLENASGLRFSESLSWMTWNPKDAVLRELHERLSSVMGQTWHLGGTTSMLERFDPDRQKRHLKDILQDTSQLSAQETQEDILKHLRAASAAPVPVDYLQRVVDEGRQEVVRLRTALAEKDDGYRAAHALLQSDLSEADLESLLREEPGLVLARLSLERELLVVTVWLEGGGLESRSTTHKVEPELLQLLTQAIEQPSQVDFERLSALLARLDMSGAFPPGRRERLVLLPSYWAATLPLVALGPKGSRPIDRFESIVWLPCLFPLRTRQAPHAPRTGHLVVVPETTQFHGLALLEPLPGELRLTGSAATPQAVECALTQVDTLSIYAHGEHAWGDLPSIGLHGGKLSFLMFGKKDLQGLERVENWACESGAQRPVDPLTNPVDEAYGLDFELLMRGVRSAIGTLWKVPDLVTAAIVRHYRQQLQTGRNAASALAEAQRWWDADGLPMLLRLLRERPQRDAIAAFSKSLGCEVEPGEESSPLGSLAPVSSQLGDAQLRSLSARFACPVSWAGLRFVGLPERRPLSPWSPPEERPLSEEERQELEQLATSDSSMPQAFDELQEARLASGARQAVDEAPSPRKALEMARQMRERINSSHGDNLLLGLAWLHEALAVPELPAVERARLCIEAAHLWLDFAHGEELLPRVPNRAVLARAEELLAATPDVGNEVDADARAARARLRWYRGIDVFGKMDSAEKLQRVSRECMREVATAMERVGTGSLESLRVATVALELLGFCGDEPEPVGAGVVAAARTLVSSVESTPDTVVALHRLRAALDSVEPDAELSHRALLYLTPRELMLVTGRTLARNAPTPSNSTELTPIFNEALGRLEGGIWGYMSDDRSPLVRSVGTPGRAYRYMLSSYLAGHAATHPGDAAHRIACLQYAGDLRVDFLHRTVRFWARFGDRVEHFIDQWRILRIRQALHTALADATLLSEPRADGESRTRPHRLDPYALPSRQLHASLEDATCINAWALGELCDVVRPGERQARTAAFEVAVVSAAMEEAALHNWKKLLESERTARERYGLEGAPVNVSRLLVPETVLQVNEKALRELPSGRGVLALTLAPSGELLAMACWNGGTTRGERTVRVPAGGLRQTLFELLRPHEQDEESSRGLSDPRSGAWARLEEALAPVLEALVIPDGERPVLSWSVFAPGALRALPLLGLRVKGRLLAEQVRGFSHAPCLGFGGSSRPEEGRDFTACLLARERRHGTTLFGEAAMETLRRAHSPELLVDTRERPPAKVVEVDVLQPHAQRIRTLRFYGVGSSDSVNDTLAMFGLEGGQVLRDRNLHELRLPQCRVVELWACTAGSADVGRVLLDAGDRIPGLAASFLCNGVEGVIDLAWPVHDLVKALVCEQYGWLRRTQGHGPETLSAAVLETRSLLEMLRGLPAGSPASEVLGCLDELRRLATRQHGFPASLVIPFAAAGGGAGWTQLERDGMVDELCHPLHLGAFRWWGN